MAMKPLVAFYSRTGTTRILAQVIAEVLACETEEIFDTKNRSGVFGLLSAAWDGGFKRATPIQETEKDPALYDIVILGTPIWNSRMACAMRTYISEHRDRLKEVAFFCTCGGSGQKRAFEEMEELSGKKPIAVLEITKQEVKKKKHGPKVDQFLQMIETKS
jgi:flavodoxin